MENIIIIIGWIMLLSFLLYCIFEKQIEKYCYKKIKKVIPINI